jgi:hypothetical protein
MPKVAVRLAKMTAGWPEKAVRLSEEALKMLQEVVRWPEVAMRLLLFRLLLIASRPHLFWIPDWYIEWLGTVERR